MRYFSGTATYRTSLHVPAGVIRPDRQIWLNLGDVREIASVSVNGRSAGTLWKAPFLIRIDGKLHAGDNAIAVEATNLWPNRLIGDLQAGARTQYTHTNVRSYTASGPLLDSGILQPVRLSIMQIERIAE